MATSGGREFRNGPSICGTGKLPVNRPRKGKGKEAPVPAYVAMQDRRGWELVCSDAVIVSRGKGTGAVDRQAV